ncbi:diphthine methyl ester synthase-like [Bolinopsis microptera]|uniref:diphthine methyl ester synthase-like n=1 Tax=Bolinopsis microptera TaxID=2820187 RepID=UPI003079552D
MLYLIGLGLGDVTDITVKGLETVRKCDKVFLEAYTSLLLNSELDTLEKYYDKEITIADREMVESESELILDPALTQDVAFLVVGDPLGATTHTDIILRAIEKGISYRVIHNASIMNAVASTGLQLYNFGDTVSICFWKENWKPTSFVDKIIKNLRNGLHVLCLLDIRVKEIDWSKMVRGNKVYEPPSYMSVNTAIEQILEIIKDGDNCDKEFLSEDTLCVGIARLGTEGQVIKSGTLKRMATEDFGKPLHSLCIVGKLHALEADMLRHFAVDKNDIPVI